MNRTCTLLVLLVILLLTSACQPIQSVAQQNAPSMLPWAQLSIEQKIANAMGGGPAAIAREATILDWPAEIGGEWIALREGSNDWTCLTDDAGFAYPTPINDPLCMDDAWVPWFEALFAGREPSITRPGVVYAYPGTAAADNDDPFATAPPAGKGFELHPPHLGLLFPGGLEPDDFPSDMHTGMPYIMYSQTPYEHLMVPIVAPSLASVDITDDPIANAMSAGPREVAQDATILDWPAEPGGEWVVLREGTNGWTCLTDDAHFAYPTPANDPMCLDETFTAWIKAYIAGEEPHTTRPGIGYMLQGGSAPDNDDPYLMEPPEGKEWHIEPPHVMVVYPEPLDPAMAHDPNSGGPYVMYAGTPYEHLMIPVDPVVAVGGTDLHVHALSEQEQFIQTALALEQAYQDEDLERVIAFYADDAISHAPGFPSDVGKEAIRVAYQSYFDTYDLARNFKLTDVEMAGDFATRTGEWTQVLTPKAGGDPITEVGRCVVGFQKINNEWKVVWEIWNTYEPAPQ